MSFNEFCNKNKIKGNFREALYHHIMAKYPTTILIESEELFDAEWKIVLNQILEKMGIK